MEHIQKQVIKFTQKLQEYQGYLFLSIAFIAGFFSYHFFVKPDITVFTYEVTDESIKEQLNKQTQAYSNIRLALNIAQKSNREMLNEFNAQEEAKQELKRELNFYRNIMAPEKTADGVTIHDVELTQLALPNQYQLQLVLTQLKKRKRAVAGKFQIVLVGIQNNEQVELNLTKLIDKKLRFQFKYFQNLTEEFTLPEGFELQWLDVKLNVIGLGKRGRAEQRYNVVGIDTREKQSHVILEQNSQVKDNLPQQTDVKR